MQGETRGAQPKSAPDALPRSVRIAVVRHERAADGDHLDLFVGPRGAEADARVARSWRLPLAAWRARSPTVDCTEGLAEGRFAAVPTPPHRAEYLDLRQPRELSEGRGRVVPLAAADGEADADGVVRALGRTFRFDQDGGGNLSIEIANEDSSNAGSSSSSPPGPNPGSPRP